MNQKEKYGRKVWHFTHFKFLTQSWSYLEDHNSHMVNSFIYYKTFIHKKIYAHIIRQADKNTHTKAHGHRNTDIDIDIFRHINTRHKQA
jgi:hypothetical protein